MKVELSLKDARTLVNCALASPAETAAFMRLERAIRRAERQLRPGRWTLWEEGQHERHWPRDSRGDREWAAVVDTSTGWMAQSCDLCVLASGPETGAEGRRLADRALAAYIRREGGDWTPKGGRS